MEQADKTTLLKQPPLLIAEDCINLKDPFFNTQLITYIGNKRRLLPFLKKGFDFVKSRLGNLKLVTFDGFSGSGSVARLLKYYSSDLHVNDLENYSETINRCFLTNRSDIDLPELKSYIELLNSEKLSDQTAGRFIQDNYAPKDDQNIRLGERAFYTTKNAKIIDNIRKLIEIKVPPGYRIYALAALLVKASVHTNTSGVFKGFHKKNGVGHFGGHGENALSRITREISLDMPIFSDAYANVSIHKRDTNELVNDKKLPELDLAYFDPPYNQHPYGSNYFMLNLINDYAPVEIQDGVSGISKDWNRSLYNKRQEAGEAMSKLLNDTRAKYILISYNDEGMIPIDEFKTILSKYGKWQLLEQGYNTYRGSRNLRDRNIMVRELLWILEKY